MRENVGSEGKTSGSHGRQAEAVEEEQKLWKRSRSCGRGSEVVEEGGRGWARTRSNGMLQYLPLKTKPSRSKIPYCDK